MLSTACPPTCCSPAMSAVLLRCAVCLLAVSPAVATPELVLHATQAPHPAGDALPARRLRLHLLSGSTPAAATHLHIIDVSGSDGVGQPYALRAKALPPPSALDTAGGAELFVDLHALKPAREYSLLVQAQLRSNKTGELLKSLSARATVSLDKTWCVLAASLPRACATLCPRMPSGHRGTWPCHGARASSVDSCWGQQR